MELNKRTLRRINNMESDIEFDLEKGIATVPLYYETPGDLLNERRSRPDKPVISGDAIDTILNTIIEIPKEFTVDINLVIDDYEDYDHDQLIKAIQKNIENTYYYYDEARKRDNVLAVILMIIGVLMLSFQVIGDHYGLFGAEGTVSTDMISSILEIFAWICIWEAGALLFLTYENVSTLFRKELRRIHSIRFATEFGEVLSSVNKDDLTKKMVSVSKKELIARNFILFTYPLIIALTVVEIGESLSQLADLSGWYMLSYGFTWLMVILLAVASISFYREKGPLKKWVLPLSLIALVYMIISVIGWFVEGEINNIFFYLDSFGTILLLINIFCLLYLRKQSVDVHQGDKIQSTEV